MNEFIHRTGRDLTWNMGEAYYNMIANFKTTFAIAYVNKDVELAYSTFKMEWIHCKSYFLDEKMKDTVKVIEKKLLIVDKSMLKKHSESRLGLQAKNRAMIANLNLLYECESLIYMLQAKTGMLQPKSTDPEQADAKYGD